VLDDTEHLWMWPASGRTPSQITDDALGDLAPAATPNGKVIVFQRRDEGQTALMSVFAMRLFVAEAPSTAAQATGVGDGFAASLSPDGSQMAFLRSAESNRIALFVRQLPLGVPLKLSTSVPDPDLTNFPTELVPRTVAWSPSGGDLFFVERDPHVTVRRHRAGADAPDAPIVTASPGQTITDLRVSPDGHRLAYLVWSAQSRTSTLHRRDLESAADRPGPAFAGRAGIAGWMGEAVVVTRAVDRNQDFSAAVEVSLVPPEGGASRVQRLDRVFDATIRLDAKQANLYATRVEDGVHNLFALSLTTRDLRRVTDNTRPGVTFSGIVPLESGDVLLVRQERKSDLFLMDALPSDAPTAR